MLSKFLNALKGKSKKSKNELSSGQKMEIRATGNAPLSDIAKQVKNIEIITKKNAELQLMGLYKSRFKGQGMQYSDVRVYQYGDDVRHIDWRSSARSQQIYVKTYEEERELNIMCLIDVSASTWFGSENKTKKESLALGIAAIALSATTNRDKVGLMLFSDQIERYVPPKEGKKHVLRLIDEMLSFKTKNKGTNIDHALKTLSGTLKHNSIIILASDFDGIENNSTLKRIAKKHDLIAMHITDPKELEIPNIGLIQLEDPETGESIVLDSSAAYFKNHFSKQQQEKFKEIIDTLKSCGASHIPISTSENPVDEVIRFFHRRKQA